MDWVCRLRLPRRSCFARWYADLALLASVVVIIAVQEKCGTGGQKMENEKRLIDANDLLQSEVKRCGCIPSIGSGYNNETSFRLILEQAPTVDAVEVVHGEWGEIYTCHGERLWGYKCSQCEYDNSKKSNYCPNCGAKMDGGN